MYAGANMGHPSRERGIVLCSNLRIADELHLGRRSNLISDLQNAEHLDVYQTPQLGHS
jgi:hypothetical protein